MMGNSHKTPADAAGKTDIASKYNIKTINQNILTFSHPNGGHTHLLLLLLVTYMLD